MERLQREDDEGENDGFSSENAVDDAQDDNDALMDVDPNSIASISDTSSGQASFLNSRHDVFEQNNRGERTTAPISSGTDSDPTDQQNNNRGGSSSTSNNNNASGSGGQQDETGSPSGSGTGSRSGSGTGSRNGSTKSSGSGSGSVVSGVIGPESLGGTGSAKSSGSGNSGALSASQLSQFREQDSLQEDLLFLDPIMEGSFEQPSPSQPDSRARTSEGEADAKDKQIQQQEQQDEPAQKTLEQTQQQSSKSKRKRQQQQTEQDRKPQAAPRGKRKTTRESERQEALLGLGPNDSSVTLDHARESAASIQASLTQPQTMHNERFVSTNQQQQYEDQKLDSEQGILEISSESEQKVQDQYQGLNPNQDRDESQDQFQNHFQDQSQDQSQDQAQMLQQKFPSEFKQDESEIINGQEQEQRQLQMLYGNTAASVGGAFHPIGSADPNPNAALTPTGSIATALPSQYPALSAADYQNPYLQQAQELVPHQSERQAHQQVEEQAQKQVQLPAMYEGTGTGVSVGASTEASFQSPQIVAQQLAIASVATTIATAASSRASTVTVTGSTVAAKSGGDSVAKGGYMIPVAKKRRQYRHESFPEKLHRLLRESEQEGKSDIVSFTPSGQAFRIHKPEEFTQEIIPKYFRHTRLTSFRRQLNLYGFEPVPYGEDEGATMHQLFLRNNPELCKKIVRVSELQYEEVDASQASLPSDQQDPQLSFQDLPFQDQQQDQPPPSKSP